MTERSALTRLHPYMTTPRLLLGLSFLLLATVGSPLRAQTSPPPAVPPQTTVIEDVFVPVPTEIFATLDRFSNSNWRAVQRPELATWKPRGDQTKIALLLGAVIAEGFIAVEATDATEVREIGRAVLTLSRGLGVEKWAIRRSRSIMDASGQEHWAAVRKEWDAVMPDVQEGMKALKSEQLAQLVSLAGWLRGAEALTALVLQNYTAADAELLRQPVMLEEFEKQLAAMNNNIRSKPAVARMRKGITRLRVLLPPEGEQISREKLKAVGGICTDLLGSLKTRG